MYVWQYAATSVALTTAVIAKSLALYPNFYAGMLAISDNSASLCVIVNQILCILWFVGKLLLWVVFGELRLAEIEYIYQKMWFLAIEGVFTVGSLSTTEPAYDFGLLITMVGFLLVFHWVLQERASVFFRMIAMPTKFEFIKVYWFTATLIYIDYRLCKYGWNELLRGNRLVILLTSHFVDLLQISIRSMCILCTDFYEAYVADIEEDDQWEPKDKVMLAIEFLLETGSLFIYAIICYTLGRFSFHMSFGLIEKFRRLYTVLGDAYRIFTTTSSINSFVSEPAPVDIARDNCCVICREEMDLNATNERLKPKKMMCGHVIHFACLKSWLGTSQNCPTCRQPVKGAKSAFIPHTLPDEIPSAVTATTTTAIAAGGPTSRPGTRPSSPENTPPDTSTWICFPTRDTPTGQEIKLGEVWYEFSVM